MVLLLRKLSQGYKYYFYEAQDLRSENFFLFGNPPILFALILACYLLMIKYGPTLMKSRKAFELKTILVVYNFLQVILNMTLSAYGAYHVFIVQEFNFTCQPINRSEADNAVIELKLVYCYFLLKVLDLFDTLFIILKKNNSHLTFLHCYHHFVMAFGVYCGVRWVPGGHGSMLGIVNTFVHGVMYSYYFLTAFKPELKTSMWWKKHITQVQLIQFMILVVHFFRAAFAQDCSYPRFWSWLLALQNSFMLALFGDFYRRAYFKKNKFH